MRFLSVMPYIRRRRAPDDASLSQDIVPPEVETPKVLSGAISSVGLIDSLEKDILKVISSVAQSAHAARALASETRVEIENIRGGMAELADNGRGVTSDVVSLAAAAEQLTMTSNEISAAMVDANGEIRDAADAAHHASSLIGELSQATREIGSVVSTIADVARQTNLLALNATIEAARAGALGRGFAVVASEVKSLAVETSEATGNISRRIERLNQSAAASIQAIERIVEIIGRIEPRFTMVESAVGQQISAIAELAERTAETSSFVAAVSDKVATMDAAASNAAGSVAEANSVTGRASDLAGDLGRRFTMVVREADLGNRRGDPRYPVARAVTLSGSGPELYLTSLDLSLGGIRLAVKPGDLVEAGARPLAEIEGLGRVSLRMVGRGKATAHAAFVDPSADFSAALKTLLVDREAHYAGLIFMMNEKAAAIVSGLETAVRGGEITQQALFEPSYMPVPGTNPEQFETAALAVLERVLRSIQEPVLEHDPRIAFCCAVDLNGYLPVHHAKYSQPQRPGDVAWNTANCRNKRIFTDTFGIFAVRAMRPFVMQTYAREMGDKTVMMASVDVPLRLFGRPWGGLRLGYQM